MATDHDGPIRAAEKYRESSLLLRLIRTHEPENKMQNTTLKGLLFKKES
jgi:hypothetical protein